MNKLIAVLCVVCWSGFWVFGYLALTADQSQASQLMWGTAVSGLCFLGGVFAYLHLCREKPVNYIRVEQRQG